MPLVAPAVRAMVFGALHEQRTVHLGFQRAGNRSEKAGPTGLAVELHFRPEQGLPAAGADKRAFTVFAVEWAGEAALGAFLAEYAVLLGRQRLAPILFRFLDFA